MTKLDSKFIQPGFIFKHNIVSKGIRYHDPSIMHLKFVNGQEKKFNMIMSTWRMMLFQIETINDYIEFERSLAGQDDELDDDA